MTPTGSAAAAVMAAASWLDGSTRAWAATVIGAVPGAVIALLASLGWLDERAALVLFVPSFVGLNAMHMAATWSRVYLAPGYARERVLERIVVPLAIGGAALAVEAVGGAILLFGIQYYVSAHHAAMQNYGLARASQRALRRPPGELAARVTQAACLLPLIAALTHRARAVCSTYDEAPIAAPPEALVVALAVAAALAVTAFVGIEVAASLRGEPVDRLGTAVVLLVTGIWVALVVLVEHPALPFFALASGHYVQYLWVAGRAERGRPGALGALPAWLRERVRPDRAPGSHLVFLAVLGASGIVCVTVLAIGARALAGALELRPHDAMPLAPWGAAMLAVNVHHYWLDHRIWRSPRRA